MNATPPLIDADRFLRILDDPRTALLVRLQDLVTRRTTEFWAARGVRNLHLPITTNSISSPMGRGSDSLPVRIELFGDATYLADSLQFMLEYGCRLSSSGAWYLMPSFRGEPADERHLNQFFHSEAELPGTLSQIMAAAEEYVRFLTASALSELGGNLAAVSGTRQHLESMVEADPFPRVAFDDAVRILRGHPDLVSHDHGGFRFLTAAGERRLIEEVGPFVWITHFDHLSVPFYQAYSDGSRRTALNADLLFGAGEVVGCGQRHADGAEVRRALAHHEVPAEDYDWYIRLKDERPMLTSGFGLGVERWLAWVFAHDDIRDMALVPRYNGLRLVP